MADITMCIGSTCPSKKECYRYTAPANPYWQAYSNFFINIKTEEDRCSHYFPDSRSEHERGY